MRSWPARSVTSMSPFGSHAMLHGFFNPSTTVTTLKVSPGGPGGCAKADVIRLELAIAPSAAESASDSVCRLRESKLDVDLMTCTPVVPPPMAGSRRSERHARSKGLG